VKRFQGSDIWSLVAVVITASVVFFIAAPMDPEPYHDGSQLPAAIGVANGLAVHQDVFSAYGFITAWMQGLAIFLFGPQLITIRIFTALVLVVISSLLFVLVRWSTRSQWTAVGISLVWVVAWPGAAVIWGTPLLPWPSVVFLAFQLAAVLLTLRGFAEQVRPARTRWFFFAGIFLGLAVLTRINYGAFLALALGASLLILRKKSGLHLREFASASIGTLIAIFIPLGVIAIQGGLLPFWDQSIRGPLQGKATVKPTEWFYLEHAYLWGSVLLSLTLLVIIWVGYRHNVPRKWYFALVSTATFGLILWTSSAVAGSPLRTLILNKLTWAPALDGQVMQPMFLAALATPIILISVVALLISHRNETLFTFPENRVFLVVLSLTAMASLVQLYPVADPNHLWWSAPLPLTLLVFSLRSLSAEKYRWAVSAVLVIPTLTISVFAQLNFITQPRTEITAGALAGMRITQSLAPNVEKVNNLLSNVKAGTASFECKEGLFAVWNGEYLPSSPDYVDYSYLLESANPGTPPERIFVCFAPESRELADEYAKANNLTIIRQTGDISLSYFANINLVEFTRND
jgi:hypothetical protein